ncbi:MAG: acyltransferase [Silvanigrellaceae bacterium]|nr:acyltransferase [Silvanigrellaceae bacterium]
MNNIKPKLTHPKYRTDIDGLRGISILTVVAFHASSFWFKGGFIGVDIFFVISGFLISTIIFSSLQQNNFSFIEFYSRRIKRIFPALLLVLIAVYAFGWFALFAHEYKQLGKHIFAGASFVSNFILWNESGYFDDVAWSKPLLHLWSLGIEEQFYIMWPLLVWAAWKKKFNLLSITILIIVTSFTLNIINIRSDSVATFYSPQTRIWELLIGSLLAWFNVFKKDVFPNLKYKLDSWLNKIIYFNVTKINDGSTLSNIQSIAGLFMIIIGVFTISKENLFPGWWAIIPTFGAALIISAGTKAWINRTVLSNRVLVWFGLISFPLYLWHWPLLSFAHILENGLPSREIRIVAIVMSILLAWLTYKIIEKPIRLGMHNRIKTITLVTIMVIVGYIGNYSFQHNGLIFRNALKKTEVINPLINDYPHKPFHNQICSNIFPQFEQFNACLISKNKNPDVLIVGDSHSNQYYQSLAKKTS